MGGADQSGCRFITASLQRQGVIHAGGEHNGDGKRAERQAGGKGGRERAINKGHGSRCDGIGAIAPIPSHLEP